jgi:hypothetical protein
MQARAVICGTGILLGIIFFLAHLPSLLLIVPVAILFFSIDTDPEVMHSFWNGILITLVIFDLAALTESERTMFTKKKQFGEVGSIRDEVLETFFCENLSVNFLPP